jgi:hypothetical protein
MKVNNSQTRRETTPTQPLYRFIEDAYCEQFVKEGKIRFGNIQKYIIGSNDVRADATESVAANINELGGVSSSSVHNEAVYILSCTRATSNADLRKLVNKFNEQGNLFLEIFNPTLFLQKVKNINLNELSKFIRMHSEDIYWVDVDYSKGTFSNQAAENYLNLHLFQKPKEQISHQIISKINGITINRPAGSAGLHLMSSCFESLWPNETKPINYEEEQECRLVLDGTHSIVVEHEGSICTFDEFECLSPTHKLMLLTENLKPKTVDINCGNLEDCVRIRDIRDIQ